MAMVLRITTRYPGNELDQPCYYDPSNHEYQCFGRVGKQHRVTLEGEIKRGQLHPKVYTANGGEVLMDLFTVTMIQEASAEMAAEFWPDCQLDVVVAYRNGSASTQS
jgi:hypothetical protein